MLWHKTILTINVLILVACNPVNQDQLTANNKKISNSIESPDLTPSDFKITDQNADVVSTNNNTNHQATEAISEVQAGEIAQASVIQAVQSAAATESYQLNQNEINELTQNGLISENDLQELNQLTGGE